ncbi:MAG TPA: hypothetical protein VIV06_00380 [Candidatus Limnocylindrales bacterium]
MTATQRAAERTRRLLDARAPDWLWRRVAAGIGVTAVVAALLLDPRDLLRAPILALGAFLLGYAISPDYDRYYLEGFADGLTAGAELAAAELESGARPLLPGLPTGAPPDEPKPAPRALYPPGGDDPDGDGSAPAIDLVDALGLQRIARPARPLAGLDGDPLPRPESTYRPRSSGFPDPPAGRPRPARRIAPARPSTRGTDRPSQREE